MTAEMCHKSLGNMLTRKQSESQVNQRLLEKQVRRRWKKRKPPIICDLVQERIETVAASIRLTEGTLDEEQLKQQLEEVQEMVRNGGLAKICSKASCFLFVLVRCLPTNSSR